MRQWLLESVCCPHSREEMCRGELAIGDQLEPVFSARDPDDLLEGVVVCVQCEAIYPVLAGVLVLMGQIRSYFRRRYPYLVAAAAGAGISPKMLAFLQSVGLDQYGVVEPQMHELPRWIQTYICSHYDDLLYLVEDDHPLASLFRDYRKQGLWAKVDEAVAPVPCSTTLDIGCNVGGMVGRLARRADRAVGIDRSFSAILAARRILIGEPAVQDSYRSFEEGARAQVRPIEPQQPLQSIELFVASAFELPFRTTFELVTILNLVDLVPAPRELLGRAAGIVASEGRLLITSPYAWTAPEEEWLGGHADVASPDALREWLSSQNFTVEWERDDIPWILRDYSRWFQVHLVHALLARRLNEEGQ